MFKCFFVFVLWLDLLERIMKKNARKGMFSPLFSSASLLDSDFSSFYKANWDCEVTGCSNRTFAITIPRACRCLKSKACLNRAVFNRNRDVYNFNYDWIKYWKCHSCHATIITISLSYKVTESFLYRKCSLVISLCYLDLWHCHVCFSESS